MSRTCNLCHVTKPESEFPMQRTAAGVPYLHSRCRACRREQVKAASKTQRGKSAKRSGILWRKFKLTEADYQRMHDLQEGKCAICLRPETKKHYKGSPLRLSVDHDHKTGRVRGLLCNMCNAGLGSFKESPPALLSALDYIASNNRLQMAIDQRKMTADAAPQAAAVH